MSNPPPLMFPGGAHPCRPCPEFIEGSSKGRPPAPCRPLSSPNPEFIEAPPRPPACRGRLAIGFQMTGGQLQVTIEVACHTDRMQVLTTIGWAQCIDACSRRLLTDALRTTAHPDPLRRAAHPDPFARLPVFAATARDLFRHAAKTLPPHPSNRTRRHRAACPARHRPSHALAAEPGIEAPPLPAAACALRNAARLQPHVTITDRAAADRCVAQALSALHGLYASFGSYLEHALQPLEPHVTRQAVRAFVLETRAELDELATCHRLGNVYTETLTITEPSDNAITLEIEAALGNAGP